MAQYFCTHCGKAIQFKVIKPPTCPSCGKGIKGTVVASPVVIPTASPSPTLLSSITSEEALAAHIQKMVEEAIKGQAKQTGAFNSPSSSSKSPRSLSRARIMERSVAGAKLSEDEEEEKTDDETDSSIVSEDDTYDEVEVQQIARELESVVKAGFHIDEDGDDDAPVKFGDLVRQRAAQGK